MPNSKQTFLEKALSLQSLSKTERLGSADRDFLTEALEIDRRFQQYLEARGRRYRDCRFSNYKVEHEGQQNAVDRLKRYAASKDSVTDGQNVVLFGPSGTGKDHLLSATAMALFIRFGIVPIWWNGISLGKELRKRSLGESFADENWNERNCPVLWISDPVPPSGSLTEFVQGELFDIIDERYSHYLPTWVTLNVGSGEEAERRIGVQTVDRLRDGALVLHCNWPSYRSSKADR